MKYSELLKSYIGKKGMLSGMDGSIRFHIPDNKYNSYELIEVGEDYVAVKSTGRDKVIIWYVPLNRFLILENKQ
ncbi:MAG: hypothetical protein WBV94_02700 [Blastocatellia bacterium]